MGPLYGYGPDRCQGVQGRAAQIPSDTDVDVVMYRNFETVGMWRSRRLVVVQMSPSSVGARSKQCLSGQDMGRMCIPELDHFEIRSVNLTGDLDADMVRGAR